VLAQAPNQLPGNGPNPIVSELGCVLCHTGLGTSRDLRERTPDLSGAGLRYQAAYLFEYLQRPTKVRQHLGRARMPDFRLNPQEALAIVAFLETQQEITGRWPELPAAVRAVLNVAPTNVSKREFEREMSGGLVCLTCHRVDGRGGALGVELSEVGYRLRREWVEQYLAAPAMFGVPATTMPAQFYQVTPDNRSFRELVPGADRKIQVLADYLLSLNTAKRTALEEKLREARAAFPDADAARGRELFTAFNCAACHRHSTIQPRTTNAAPDLARETHRVNAEWLVKFLKAPAPIRSFGFRPGDGSRMPDFHLSDSETAEITSFLTVRAGLAEERIPEFKPVKLSAFAAAKAHRLLEEKPSCLGCHRLGERGGCVGPDLTAVHSRLRPAHIYGIIANPRAETPHSVMPKVPLTDETARLISSYLLQYEIAARPAAYLSPLDYPLIPFGTNGAAVNDRLGARERYLHYCAPCHGNDGRGDGFNARFLPVQPTRHADATHMSVRPDDTLFDGIHSGGYILGKSPFMPPWGSTFSGSEIQGLVAYLRTLCECKGPSWSLDNVR